MLKIRKLSSKIYLYIVNENDSDSLGYTKTLKNKRLYCRIESMFMYLVLLSRIVYNSIHMQVLIIKT